MKKHISLLMVGALFGVATTVFAQGSQTTTQTQGGAEPRPVTTTTSGDTGIWFVPTAEVLRRNKWSISFYGVNSDNGQGFTDVQHMPITYAFGVGNHVELFGNWAIVTGVDRDTNPLFFQSTAKEINTGTGGGIHPDYPLMQSSWSEYKVGDAWVGGKVAVLGSEISRFDLAARGMVKIPTGDDTAGVSSGKTDFAIDGVVSGYLRHFELAGYGGYIVRGNPTGYTLTNGVRWGVGTALANVMSSGIRVSAELFGEHYMDKAIAAPPGLLGADGSPVPILTYLKDPVTAAIGVTWQASNGFFIGGGGSWNFGVKGRSEAEGIGLPAFTNTGFGDQAGFQVRIGYSPFSKPVAPPPPPPPPTPPPTPPPPPPPPPANRVPVVQASCDPCRVEVGKTARVSADARDPDGDALTYRWTGGGTLATPTGQQSGWTAPMTPGRVTLTVAVADGKGGTASATTAIDVVAAPRKEFAFEDVHFDYDRFTLLPDALKILDDAVTAMQANPELNLLVEGHTCNIGTTEYNLALGERRAKAVRDYLLSRGIGGNRVTTVSYGEERPKFDNDRGETRRLNRRAALVVKLQ